MECKLIIDSREKDPLNFRETDNYKIEQSKMDVGDYGLLINNKLVFAFERKSSIDLFGTLTHSHDRFKEEIKRAKENNVPLVIVIENSYSDIIKKKFGGSYHSSMPGYVLIKILHTMQIRYNIPFLFFNNREEMRDYIRNTFTTIIKEEEIKLKNKEKQAKLEVL